MENFGSIYALSVLPIWATAAILFAVMMVPILVGRDIMEGIPYNVAYSAIIGDVFLMIGVLIAATILQRGAHISLWLQNGFIHFTILLLCIILGIFVNAITLDLRSVQVMDVYHDVIVAPLILYLAITLLPIIFINGTKTEIAALMCFVLIFLGTVGFDIKYKRMDQRSWLQNNGVTLRR